MNTIKTAFVQMYKDKVSLLSQQMGGRYGKSKVQSTKSKARKNTKKNKHR
jgi:hypothetical protein